MAEHLVFNKEDKKANYALILPQIKALCEGEKNAIAILANVSSALKEAFGFFWEGFYLVDSEEELVLGPFQGTIACTRIKKGKGVCGTAWQLKKTVLVPNVEEFPGHIACSTKSKSEIVVPIFKENKVIGVLDVDSDKFNDFDEVDDAYLNELMTWLGEHL